MNIIRNSFFLACLISVIVSCSSKTSNSAGTANDTNATDSNSVKRDSIAVNNGSIPIFYNMYLSVELSTLFQSIGVSYNPVLLNSPDKTSRYETTTQKSVNLGVYAVDLSYAKYFDQFNLAGKYLNNMQKLSSELGIPNDKFTVSLKRIENNLANKDSLVKIANDIYKTSENYLKQNDRGSSAALIIAGGWVEAVYIASSLVKKGSTDNELIDRIAEQKHSVKDLVSLLNAYKNEQYVRNLLVKLNDLSASLERLEINKENMDITYKQLAELSVKITSIRKNFID
jgi:hypothetical protein